jgi:hypothetical protein
MRRGLCKEVEAVELLELKDRFVRKEMEVAWCLGLDGLDWVNGLWIGVLCVR